MEPQARLAEQAPLGRDGTAGLEHLWHGEIVPWPPFLTAMENPADIAPMLHEIATTGTGMAVFVTIFWLLIVTIADQKVRTLPKVRVDSVAGGR